MYTGIVTDKGTLEKKSIQNDIVRFDVKTSYDVTSIKIGESISLDGVCLTVVATDSKKNTISFDIMPETIDKTNFSEKSVGDEINLERSLSVGDKLSGHFVQGHVDTKIHLLEAVLRGDSRRLYFELPEEYVPYIKTKGSIALNGVSLTVSSTDNNRFSVDLIPLTIDVTTFGALNAGDSVNLEIDMLARYVRD